MKKLIGLLISLGMALTLYACGGGSGGTSVVTPSPSKLKYSFILSGDLGFYLNSPMLYEGNVFIGTSKKEHSTASTSNKFYKLKFDLTKIWEYELGGKETMGTSTVDSLGNIYFLVTDRTNMQLVSLDQNGTLRWSKDIGYGGHSMRSPAYFNEKIIIPTNSGVMAFDTTGTKLWTYFGGTVKNSPLADKIGNFYFTQYNNVISVVSITNDGALRWKYDAADNSGTGALPHAYGEYQSSPVFSGNNTIVAAIGNFVVKLSMDDGTKIWTYSPPELSDISYVVARYFRATPAVDSDGTIYVGSKANAEGTMFSIKSDGSGLKWKVKIGADLYSSPAIGSDGTLYFGSEQSANEQRVHAYNATTGDKVWSDKMSGNGDITWSSPVIASNGLLYIANMNGDSSGQNGSVAAFETLSTGLKSDAHSACYRSDISRTGAIR